MHLCGQKKLCWVGQDPILLGKISAFKAQHPNLWRSYSHTVIPFILPVNTPTLWQSNITIKKNSILIGSSVFLDHFPLQTIRLLVFFGGKPAPSKKVAISWIKHRKGRVQHRWRHPPETNRFPLVFRMEGFETPGFFKLHWKSAGGFSFFGTPKSIIQVIATSDPHLSLCLSLLIDLLLGLRNRNTRYFWVGKWGWTPSYGQ